MRRRLGEVFASRADGIKASAALASLAALADASGDWAERQRVHDAIEVLLQRPEAHQLRLLEALTLVTSGSVTMPADLTAEILQLGGSSRPDEQLGRPDGARPELQALALERAGWWRSFASFGATPGQSRVAHVVHRAYFLLWQELKGQLPTGPPGELAGGPQPPGQPGFGRTGRRATGLAAGPPSGPAPGFAPPPWQPQPRQPPATGRPRKDRDERRGLRHGPGGAPSPMHRRRARPPAEPTRAATTPTAAPCSTC